MGLTREFYRFVESGRCNGIGTGEGGLAWVAPEVVASAAGEWVLLWNVRTGAEVGRCAGTSKVTAVETSGARGLLAVGYAQGEVRLFDLSSSSSEPLLVFAGHKSAVGALAFSSDGLLLASGGRDSAVVLWDVVAEAGLCRLHGHKGPLTRLRFAQGSRFLLTASKDSFLKFWDIRARHCFFTLADHRSELWDFALSEEDTRLVTGSVEQELRLYQLHWKLQGEQDDEDPTAAVEEGMKRLKTSVPEGAGVENANDQATDVVRVERLGLVSRGAKGRVAQLLQSPDEELLLALGGGGGCDVFRLFRAEESQKRLAKKVRKRRKGPGMDSVRLEDIAAEVAKDLTTHVIRLGLFSAQEKGVKLKRLAFNQPRDKQGHRVVTLLSNNSLGEERLWVAAEKGLGRATSEGRGVWLAGHRAEVRAIAFSSDDLAFLTAASDGLKLWNRSSLQPLRSLAAAPTPSSPAQAAISAIFLPGDRHCLVGRKDGALEVWDVPASELLQSIPDAHQGTIWALSLTADEKGVVSAGADKTVRLWTLAMRAGKEGKRVLSLAPSGTLELPEEVLCLSVSANGKFIAVGLLDNTAQVYFADSLKFFLSLYGHSLPVLCMDIASDSRLIVTGAADKNVKLWGLDFGDCHKSLFAHDDSVTAVKFLPKTHLFFSCGKDGKVKQWDGDKFQRIQVLEGHCGEVWALAVSSKGAWVASAGADRTVRVWEETEELLVAAEEEEEEREKEAERDASAQDDVVPGEVAGEASLPTRKTADTLRAAENVMDALRIRREQLAGLAEDPAHPPHPLMTALKSSDPDSFVADMLRRTRSAELEKSLLLVPFGEALDLIGALRLCVERGHEAELSSRALFFLCRVHHNQLVSGASGGAELVRLASAVPRRLGALRDAVGTNLAALSALQAAVEEREDVQLFADAQQRLSKKAKKNRIKQSYTLTLA